MPVPFPNGPRPLPRILQVGLARAALSAAERHYAKVGGQSIADAMILAKGADALDDADPLTAAVRALTKARCDDAAHGRRPVSKYDDDTGHQAGRVVAGNRAHASQLIEDEEFREPRDNSRALTSGRTTSGTDEEAPSNWQGRMPNAPAGGRSMNWPNDETDGPFGPSTSRVGARPRGVEYASDEPAKAILGAMRKMLDAAIAKSDAGSRAAYERGRSEVRRGIPHRISYPSGTPLRKFASTDERARAIDLAFELRKRGELSEVAFRDLVKAKGIMDTMTPNARRNLRTDDIVVGLKRRIRSEVGASDAATLCELLD